MNHDGNSSPLGPDLSWDDIRCFLSVARAGSAHRAAQSLGLSHTTIGRRLNGIESRLKRTLFERRGNALILTEIGQTVLADAIRMDEAALAFRRKLHGADTELTGEIRINVTEGLGTFWLMPGLQPFLAQHPKLVANWYTTNTVLPSPTPDAEISVLWWRPTETHVVARKLGNVGYSMFTTAAYEARFGLPKSDKDLAKHFFLHFNGYDLNDGLKAWNDLIRRFPPKMRLESTSSAPRALQTGNFITLLPDYSTLVVPGLLRRVPIELGISLELWMTYHEDHRKSARLAAVAKELARLANQAKGSWLSA
jgi:DNA-binding transcriptional LysR family regulator